MSTKRNTSNQTTEKNAPCHDRKEKKQFVGQRSFSAFHHHVFIHHGAPKEREKKKSFLTSLVGANRSMFGHCAKNIFFSWHLKTFNSISIFGRVPSICVLMYLNMCLLFVANCDHNKQWQDNHQTNINYKSSMWQYFSF